MASGVQLCINDRRRGKDVMRVDAAAGWVEPRCLHDRTRLLSPACRDTGMPMHVAIDRTLDLPGLVVTEHPETRAVVATHQGPYELLSQSYEEITAWFSGQELPLEESMFEFYDSPPEEDPATTITRIVFPLSDD